MLDVFDFLDGDGRTSAGRCSNETAATSELEAESDVIKETEMRWEVVYFSERLLRNFTFCMIFERA